MSYHIQSYGKGSIRRNGDKYELNVDGVVVGSYSSVQELVEAHPLEKQVASVHSEATEADVVTTPTTKAKK
jgi:hypothetical protein